MSHLDNAITAQTKAGILIALEICGVGSVTFHVTLTAEGNGWLYDPEACGYSDPIEFSHSLGTHVSTIMAAVTPGDDRFTTFEYNRFWFDLRTEDAKEAVPESVGSAFVDIEDALAQLFWDELNDQLGEDAVIAEGDIDDEECGFENGDQETFDRAITLAQACWLRLHPGDSFMTEIATGDDETPEDATPEALQPLITAIANAFGLTGGTYEYNDEDSSRKSGYSYCSRSHYYDSADVRDEFSARELIEAPKTLIALLEPFGIDPRESAPDLFGTAQTAQAA